MGENTIFTLNNKILVNIFLIIIVGVNMMNLNGCGQVVGNEELAGIKLNEKYDSTFVIETIVEKDMINGYYTCLAYNVEEPDILFRVNVDIDGEGASDNYVSKCVFRKIADRVGINFDNMNGYFYIYCAPLVERTGLDNPSMEIEEYVDRVPDGKINVYLHYAPEKMDINSFYNNLQNVFNGIGNMGGTVYLYITDEDGLNNAQDYIESHDQIYYDYTEKMKTYYKGAIKIEGGKPVCSLEELKKMVGE